MALVSNYGIVSYIVFIKQFSPILAPVLTVITVPSLKLAYREIWAVDTIIVDSLPPAPLTLSKKRVAHEWQGS